MWNLMEGIVALTTRSCFWGNLKMEVLEFCPKQLHQKFQHTPQEPQSHPRWLHWPLQVNCGEATVLRKKMNSLTLERSYPSMPCGIWWAHDENMCFFLIRTCGFHHQTLRIWYHVVVVFFPLSNRTWCWKKNHRHEDDSSSGQSSRGCQTHRPKKSWSRAAENLEFGGTEMAG